MRDEEFFYVCDNLLYHDYKFAKTMKNNPHWYTLRRTWDRDGDFVKTVELLRAHGYDRNWYGHHYTSFNVNDHYYWTMGEPINLNGKPHTILINKARREVNSQYDDIAEEYDSFFEDEDSKRENEEVISLLGIQDSDSVLDVGCGTGLVLDYVPNIRRYVGLEPSSEMMTVMKRKHPDAEVINTGWENFYTREKFDKILFLFGTPNYINPETMSRIKHFLKPNGKAFLMFYKPDYSPVTYEKAGKKLLNHNSREYDGIDFENAKEIGNFLIVEVCA